MEFLDRLFDAAPLLALFITIAFGYVVGKLTIGHFVLGGVAGTLLVGVGIGQFGIDIDPSIKTIFFALFIYAVGYQGGPQFFHALNLRSLNELASAFVMCVVGLLCVLAAAWIFGLDRGTAAGLAAGGLTQSAIIGTAGEAIDRLNVSAAEIKAMQTNVAVGYAVCYIFGQLGPIILATWFIPMVMGWDIREEARKLAKQMSGGAEIAPGEFEALRPVVTRVYEVSADGGAAGKTVRASNEALEDTNIEAVFRLKERMEAKDDTVLQAGDMVAVTGKIDGMVEAAQHFGREISPPWAFDLVEEARGFILTNPALAGKTIAEVHTEFGSGSRFGVYLTGIKRLGRKLPILHDVTLHKGDELQFIGTPKDLDRVQQFIGDKISAAAVTDFVFFGLGMGLGMLLGMIEFHIAGVPVSIGSGGGCLLSGLLFGWLRSTHPRVAAVPSGATNFLSNFGLAVFVAVVGISAGPQALTTIQQSGAQLFLLGVAVTIIPSIVVFYFSYYVLRIRNPIEALACMIGGRSANPAFVALMDKAGNATPVVAFTVTYAVANVFLTIWGPIVVGVIDVNPTVSP